MSNPYATINCYFCNSYGCFCPLDQLPHKDAKDCMECDVCEGTGELSQAKLDRMAADYKADEAWERAKRTA